MLRELDESPGELAEWMAYYRLEPFGDQYRQAGKIAAATYNASGFITEAIQADEFLPVLPPPIDEPEDDDPVAGMTGMLAAMAKSGAQ